MPAALERGEVRDRRPPVAGAGGNDDGSRAHRAAIGELEAYGIAVGLPPQSSRATSSGMAISTPNFSAWLKARPASAMPEMPVGNPR